WLRRRLSVAIHSCWPVASQRTSTAAKWSSSGKASTTARPLVAITVGPGGKNSGGRSLMYSPSYAEVAWSQFDSRLSNYDIGANLGVAHQFIHPGQQLAAWGLRRRLHLPKADRLRGSSCGCWLRTD